MYGVSLLHLARLVGLSQTALADHLGISNVQIHYWAQGERPIPAGQIPTLVKRITEALARALVMENTAGLVVPLDELGRRNHRIRSDRSALRELVEGVFAENLMRDGLPPSSSLANVVTVFEAYLALPRKEQWDMKQLWRLAEASTAMNVIAHLLLYLMPMVELLEMPLPHITPTALEATHAHVD